MLKQIIIESGLTQRAWADKIGIQPGYLSKLLGGSAIPSLEVAARIERLTEGAVPAASWVADYVAVSTSQVRAHEKGDAA